MKMIGLQIENLRKIRAAQLDFDGHNLIQIRGRNEAGKSTVIQAIEMLLGGKKAVPGEVVTHGETRASVVGQIDHYTVKRTIKGDNTYLTVESSESGKVASPQDFLSRIAGQFIDPQAFASMDGPGKRAAVIEYLGIDFTAIDAEIGKAEVDRTVASRRLKAFGELKPLPKPAQTNLTPIETLMKALNEAEETNAAIAERNKDRTETANKLGRVKDAITQYTQARIALVQQLADLDAKIKDAEGQRERGTKILEGKGEIEPSVSTEEIRAQITAVNTAGEVVRAYNDYLKKREERDTVKKEHDDLTANIEAMRKKKADMVTNAAIIPGLTITETGLFYNGNTDENWSDSESLMISLMVAAKLSGELKMVYIKRGESLDPDSLAEVAKFAKENDMQVIIEIVDNTYSLKEDGVFYLEEGEIVTTGGKA
jgi:DNA repair exonuclease SbcCD ATPase subunit